MSAVLDLLATAAPLHYADVPAKRLDRNAVVHALRADTDDLGFAIARFRLERGQAAWNPDGTRVDRRDFVGPASVVYERQLGRITARYA